MEKFETKTENRLKTTYTAKTFESAVQTVQYIWGEINRKNINNAPVPTFQEIQQYFTESTNNEYRLGNINLSVEKETRPTENSDEIIQYKIYVQCADDGGDYQTKQAVDEIIRSIDIRKGNIQYWKKQLSDLELTEYNDVLIESRPPREATGYVLITSDVSTTEGVVDVYGSPEAARLFIYEKEN